MGPFTAILLLLQLSAAPAAPTGIVSGQLLRPNGKPAAGVRIAVTPVRDAKDAPGAGDLMSLAQTDETGHYRLENIPPGQYFIQAGPLDSPNYYPGVLSTDRAMSITVNAGNVLEVPEFRLPKPPGATITGRLPPNLPVFPSDIAVLPANIHPVLSRLLSGAGRLGSTTKLSINNGAVIIESATGGPDGGPSRMVFSVQAFDSRYYPAQIHSDGTFEISGILPGVYSLIAVPSNPLLIRTVPVGPDDIELSGPSKVGWKVSGVVGLSEATRVPNQRLTLSGNMWGQMEATSDSSGAFAFVNVPSGVFSIRNSEGTELSFVNVTDHDLDRIAVPALFLLNGNVVVNMGTPFPPIRITATTPDGKKIVSNVIYGRNYGGGPEAGFSLPFLEGEYRITAELPGGQGVVESLMYGPVDLKTNPMIVRFPAQTLRITIGKH